MRLRLRLLREPLLQRGEARRLHAAGAGRPHHRVLPPQLHRGAVPKLGRHQEPRLHHRAHDPDAVASAGRARLPRLHPRQGRARHLARARGRAGAFGRPHEREHGAALAAESGPARPREEQAADHRAHAPDPRQHRGGQGHPRARAQEHHLYEDDQAEEEGAGLRARRSVHADDRGGHARKRFPDTQPLGRALPHALAQARVLQRLHARERRRAPALHRRPAAQPRAPALPGGLASALLPLRRHRDHRRGAPVPGPRGGPEGELGAQQPGLLPRGGEQGAARGALARARHRREGGARHHARPAFHHARRARAAQAGHRLQAGALLRHLQRQLRRPGDGFLARGPARAPGRHAEGRQPRPPRGQGHPRPAEPVRERGDAREGPHRPRCGTRRRRTTGHGAGGRLGAGPAGRHDGAAGGQHAGGVDGAFGWQHALERPEAACA